ncbi:MAG TPA: hypothetical protein VL992_13880 [Tepidisphaeraceae bacterium]|nr:hypothetical protein [Tepidisphaeraceae bacterium]
MELEPSSTVFDPVPDSRPRVLPPPPVQLVAIADVSLPAVAGLESDLDAFYAGLLKFEREHPPAGPGHQIVYRAENARLRLSVHETPPTRPDFRPALVVVPRLSELVQRLNDAEKMYVRQPGLAPGAECVVLQDPAGNWVHVSESVQIG